MSDLELARGNNTATSIVIQRFNITPELAYLLQESFDVTGPGGVGGEVILLP
jgi:plasmid maintenance system antidote protein VapI